MRSSSRIVSVVFLGGAMLSGILPATASAEATVEIIRDKWGIAHVYGDDEPAAFFGVGYATAEDRMLQMMLKRRVAQGRIAEILGPGDDNQHIKSDLRYRTLGFVPHAARLLANEDAATRKNLEAYAAGVNAYLDEHRGKLSPLFDQYGGHPEPWSAADCITIWSARTDRFTSRWAEEFANKRKVDALSAEQRRNEPPTRARPMLDNARAIVTEEEFRRQQPELHGRLAAKTQTELKRIAAGTGDPQHQPDGPNFSHNWLVGGEASTTGKPILESDPHYGIVSPSFWYEIHIVGGRYNVRGIGVAGAPGFLIGWNDKIAWGATALGGDQADLFEERLNPEKPDLYRYKGDWFPFEAREETIAIKGREPLRIKVRSTRHGPVVNDLLDGVKENEVFALQSVWLKSDTCSLEAALRMMAARDWPSFREGARTYVGPPLHQIYADTAGNIGYQTLGRATIRYVNYRLPRQGWTGKDEWEGYVPFDEIPFSLNPKNHRIGTANNLAVGDWYPYLLTTALGDGPRSQRIHELLDQNRKFSVEDFRTLIHIDDSHPNLRDILTLARAVVAESGAPTPEVEKALAELKDWQDHFRTDQPGYPVAHGIVEAMSSRLLNGTQLEKKYGSRLGGICRMLRECIAEHKTTGRAPSDPEVRKWFVDIIHAGYLQRGFDVQQREATGYNWQAGQSDVANIKGMPKANKHPPEQGLVRYLPYQDNAEGFGSLAPQFDILTEPLPVPHTHTLWSQEGNSYTQIVDLADIDRSLSMLPPGISENPHGPHFTDQLEYLYKGTLHPAPLTRPGVEKVKTSAKRVRIPRGSTTRVQ